MIKGYSDYMKSFLRIYTALFSGPGVRSENHCAEEVLTALTKRIHTEGYKDRSVSEIRIGDMVKSTVEFMCSYGLVADVLEFGLGVFSNCDVLSFNYFLFLCEGIEVNGVPLTELCKKYSSLIYAQKLKDELTEYTEIEPLIDFAEALPISDYMHNDKQSRQAIADNFRSYQPALNPKIKPAFLKKYVYTDLPDFDKSALRNEDIDALFDYYMIQAVTRGKSSTTGAETHGLLRIPNDKAPIFALNSKMTYYNFAKFTMQKSICSYILDKYAFNILSGVEWPDEYSENKFDRFNFVLLEKNVIYLSDLLGHITAFDTVDKSCMRIPELAKAYENKMYDEVSGKDRRCKNSFEAGFAGLENTGKYLFEILKKGYTVIKQQIDPYYYSYIVYITQLILYAFDKTEQLADFYVLFFPELSTEFKAAYSTRVILPNCILNTKNEKAATILYGYHSREALCADREQNADFTQLPLFSARVDLALYKHINTYY